MEPERPVATVATDEPGHEVVDGVGQQVGGVGHLRELAADPQDGHLVAELDRLVDVVRDEEDGLAELALQAQELVLQLVADDGVDRGEGLVHEHHRGVGGEGARHPYALLLPAGQLAGVALREGGVEPDPLQQLHRAGPGLRLVPAEQLGDGADVVEHRAVREQAGVLDDVADAAAHLGRVHRAGVLVVEPDAARGGLDHAVDHAEGRRLAAPGRPDEHRDLAGGGLEVEVVHRRRAAGILLRDVVEANHGDDPKRDRRHRPPTIRLRSDHGHDAAGRRRRSQGGHLRAARADRASAPARRRGWPGGSPRPARPTSWPAAAWRGRPSAGRRRRRRARGPAAPRRPGGSRPAEVIRSDSPWMSRVFWASWARTPSPPSTHGARPTTSTTRGSPATASAARPPIECPTRAIGTSGYAADSSSSAQRASATGLCSLPFHPRTVNLRRATANDPRPARATAQAMGSIRTTARLSHEVGRWLRPVPPCSTRTTALGASGRRRPLQLRSHVPEGTSANPEGALWGPFARVQTSVRWKFLNDRLAVGPRCPW